MIFRDSEVRSMPWSRSINFRGHHKTRHWFGFLDYSEANRSIFPGYYYLGSTDKKHPAGTKSILPRRLSKRYWKHNRACETPCAALRFHLRDVRLFLKYRPKKSVAAGHPRWVLLPMRIGMQQSNQLFSFDNYFEAK